MQFISGDVKIGYRYVHANNALEVQIASWDID